MAGFDIGSLGAVNLNKLIEDNRADFSKYLLKQVARPVQVDSENGTIERWETPMSMDDGGSENPKHAPGSPTPKGNTAMGRISYVVDNYGWAEGINHLSKIELGRIPGALAKLSEKSGHKVMGGMDRELARVLGGSGTAALNQDLSEKAVGVAWDVPATATPISDIDAVALLLRPGNMGLIGVFGYDVLLNLTRCQEMINHADKGVISIDEVITMMKSRGLSQIITDWNPAQTGEPTASRAYQGIFDGIAYVGTIDNILLPEMEAFGYDTYRDDDRKKDFFRASAANGVIRGYKEHGYFFSGITT